MIQSQFFLQRLGTDGHGSDRGRCSRRFPLLLLLSLLLLGVGGRRSEAAGNDDGEEEGEEEEHDQVALVGAPAAAPAAARHSWCLACVWTAWVLWLCVCM